MSASGEIATCPVESITPELFGLELRPVTYGIVELWPAECQALVDVYVGKLGEAAPNWSFIHTHFGLGYRFDSEPRDGEQSSLSDGCA